MPETNYADSAGTVASFFSHPNGANSRKECPKCGKPNLGRFKCFTGGCDYKPPRDKAHEPLNVAEFADKCTDADPFHSYLQKKRVKPLTLKQYGDSLYIFCRTVYDETPVTYQELRSNGEKRNQPGGKIAGTFHIIPGSPDLVILCEGYATGATIFETTGATVVVCLDCPNLERVAPLVRDELFPNAKMIIAGDNDHGTPGNPGEAHATKAAQKADALFVIPRFPRGVDSKKTDFNDLYLWSGLAAVETQLAAAKEPPKEVWRDQLKLHKVGKGKDASYALTKCLHNTIVILANDPHWKGRIRYDEFGCRIMLDDRPWQDEDGILAAAWMHASEHNMNVSSEMVEKAVMVVARANSYHPVKDYLNGIQWDGIPRLDNWLIQYMGVEDNPYTRTIGKCTLIAAVARIFEPGCKSKYVLYLDGEQDIGKSTAVEALCPDPAWFTDDMSVIGNKDVVADMAGKWIIELSELQAIKGKDAALVKSFVSRTTDRRRVQYERHSRDFPRQCIFIATTNPDHTLNDATGNVRWWPINCEFADVDGIRAAKDQLWAEAVALYHAGEQWHITDEHVLALAKEAQSDKEYRHAWTDAVEEFLEGREFATMEEVLRAVGLSGNRKVAKELNLEYAPPKEIGDMRATLLRLGWRSKRPRVEVNGKMTRVNGYAPKAMVTPGHPMVSLPTKDENRITMRSGHPGHPGQTSFEKPKTENEERTVEKQKFTLYINQPDQPDRASNDAGFHGHPKTDVRVTKGYNPPFVYPNTTNTVNTTNGTNEREWQEGEI